MVLDVLESIVGGLLLFVVPGAAWSRAIFPEWRFRGPDGLLRIVETVTLAFLCSVALTILVGFALTAAPPGPYPASWSDPVLESVLALIALAGFVVALYRGGFRAVAPNGPEEEPPRAIVPPMQLLREIAEIRTEERRIRHRLRRAELAEADRTRLVERLAELEGRVRALEREREAEYVAA